MSAVKLDDARRVISAADPVTRYDHDLMDLTMNGKRRLLGSFNHGSMANALPQAIGAQITFRGRGPDHPTV